MLMANLSTSDKKLWYCDLGNIPYDEAWELQGKIFRQRKNGFIPDVLLLLEHPHTYTLGKVASRENLIADEEYLRKEGISVFDIDRGGDITYHGPGQIVGYPIIDLEGWKKDSHKYLRALEEIIILTASEYGLKCGRNEKYTGVWIENRKIAAIGIKISSWITMHGFAFNVNTDLSKFRGIIPCGISDKDVTSLEIELGSKIGMQEVVSRLVKNFIGLFEYGKIENVTKEFINEQLLSKAN